MRSDLSRRRLLQATGAGAMAAALGASYRLGDISAQDAVALNFTTPAGAETVEREQAWFDANEAQYGVDVTISAVSGSGFVLYLDKLKTQLAGGEPPDAARMYTGYLATPYVSYMTPLDDYYEQYGWDELIVGAAIQKTLIDDKKYGLPVSINGMPFWYSIDAYTKAGITAPPTTFDELEANNDKLKAAGYVPLAEGGKFGWDIMRVFEFFLEKYAGPELHDQLINMEASWEDQSVVDSFAAWKRWVDNGWVNEGFLGMAPDDADTMLTQGTAAMLLTGPWEENNIRNANLDLAGFAVFPGPTDQETVRFSSFIDQWQIPNEGKNIDKTIEILNAFIQPAAQAEVLNSAPATIGALDPAASPLGAAIFDLINTHETFLVLDQAMPQEVTNAFFDQQASVSTGSTSPEDAASAMQSAIEDFKSNQ